MRRCGCAFLLEVLERPSEPAKLGVERVIGRGRLCVFAPETGRLLGAQAVGREGVDKRIDVLATALHAGMTVDDVAELELAYAPPYGSAKDPVNLAGMAAQNVMAGDVALAQWHEVAVLDPESALLLDVRDPEERANGFIPRSLHIPLRELRHRISELPHDKEIVVYCQTGQRSYYASRILSQHGFRVRNLTGSYRTWKIVQENPRDDDSPKDWPRTGANEWRGIDQRAMS